MHLVTAIDGRHLTNREVESIVDIVDKDVGDARFNAEAECKGSAKNYRC